MSMLRSLDASDMQLQNVQFVCDNATTSLYSAAAGLQPSGNLLISPLSIVYSALLLYLGSRGDTRSNLDTALHFTDYFGNDSSSDVIASFANALTLLKVPAAVSSASANGVIRTSNSSRNRTVSPKKGGRLESAVNTKDAIVQDPRFQLALANGVFVEESYKLDANFLSNVTTSLRASVTSEKFLKASVAARKDINDWVDARTGGKIKDLIPVGGVDVSTKAVLVNAVYFKSQWMNAFPISATKKGDFHHLAAGKKSTVDFMHVTRSLNYMENTNLGFQYVEIPYVHFEASLVVLLPRKADGLRQLEAALTPDLLRSLALQADDANAVQVALPKFTMHSSFDLVKLMQKIGVDDAFTTDADLSGMAPSGDVQVSNAFHKTFIDVNEKGTEAAAASAMVIATKMAMFERPLGEAIVFNADHPFLYAIRHNPSKLIVFIGRIESF